MDYSQVADMGHPRIITNLKCIDFKKFYYLIGLSVRQKIRTASLLGYVTQESETNTMYSWMINQMIGGFI